MATKSVTSFEVAGADGLPMHGNVHTAARPGERRPTVVICHGFKGFKDWGFFPALADRLATAGFTAVRFNLSGAGVSEGEEFDEPERFAHDTFSRALADLASVIDWTGADDIGIVGHSRGGGLAALQAARDPRVKTLVTWASIASVKRWDDATVRSWREQGVLHVVNQRTGQVLPLYTDMLDDLDRQESGLDIEAAAARVEIPWLVIHGTEDETVSAAEGRLLAASSRSGDRELLLIEGAGHTFGARHPWHGPTAHLEEVVGATILWLSRHLSL
jgi:pimeloyl-ACP methyl ester carboxylesterase